MCNIMNFQQEKTQKSVDPEKDIKMPPSIASTSTNIMGYHPSIQDVDRNRDCAVGHSNIGSSPKAFIETRNSPDTATNKTEIYPKCSLTTSQQGPDFVKMKSAEKRRFKKALSQGFSREKALEFAKGKSETTSSLKRPPTTTKNPFKDTDKRMKFTQTPSDDGCVNMGLIPLDLFENPFDQTQIDRLQEAIIDAAIETRSEIKPEFEGCLPRKGWLMVTCTNRNTAEWLRSNVHVIKEKSRVQLTVVEETDFPCSYYVQGSFPNSQGLANSKILDTIEAQNQLKASTWKVLQRKWSEGSTVHLSLSVDAKSWTKLAETNGRIAYRFGHINLQLQKANTNDESLKYYNSPNWHETLDNKPSTSREAHSRQQGPRPHYQSQMQLQPPLNFPALNPTSTYRPFPSPMMSSPLWQTDRSFLNPEMRLNSPDRHSNTRNPIFQHRRHQNPPNSDNSHR
ncbi:uncharacterized protein LOC142237739 [Haematobia irritans]|uniref:uncharacterized protein LOC142237739 n=1 Tax=Haematobia irritans TaxID=7368 RepID=UPI003F4FBB75